MKLIKQNDSAGGLIFKQNVNGKAMKQNYNFGQTIILPSGLFLDFPSIVGVPFNDFSCVMYIKSVSISSNFNGIINTEWDYDKVIQARVVQIGTGRVQLNVGNISNSPGRLSIACPFESLDKSFIYLDLNIVRANSLTANNTFTNFFPSVSSGININKYLRDNTSAQYDSSNPLKISEIRIYPKRLQSYEFTYEYNFKLGNEPIITPMIWIKPYYASIIDFGGTIGNAVGIIDISGNGHHARINGVPAGTLQEQLDYANANLFESW